MVVIEELAGAGGGAAVAASAAGGGASGDGAACAALGAGLEEANGLYLCTGRLWYGALVFENDRGCLLSREPHKDRRTGETRYGWILGKNQKPFYVVQSEELAPPASGWRCFGALAPAPEVQHRGSLGEAARVLAQAWKEQGNTLFAAQRYQEADARWTRALGLSRHLGEDAVLVALYANRSEAKLRQSSWEAALRDAREAARRDPGHDKALLRGALAASKLRRFDVALELVQQCLEAHPRLPQALRVELEVRKLVEEARQELPDLARSARRKLQQAISVAAEEGRLGDLPRELREKQEKQELAKKELRAFSGYGGARGKTSGEPAPLSSLPYHCMGLPQNQVDLMDNFFSELRAKKAQQKKRDLDEGESCEKIKIESRERSTEGEAAGAAAGTTSPASTVASGGGDVAAAGKVVDANDARPETTFARLEPMELPQTEKERIDSLFTGSQFEPGARRQDEAPAAASAAKEWRRRIEEGKRALAASFAGSAVDRRTRTERALDEEEAEEKRLQARRAQAELEALRRRRGGEPTRFEQAAGEVYCWWALPPAISGREVRVAAAQGGSHMSVAVRDVVVFDRKLFQPIRADDVVWSVNDRELHVTLTKAERNKLWDQLGEVQEVRRDAADEVVPETVPEALSASARLEHFRQMVEGDDGQQPSWDALEPDARRLVEALRRYEHARAVGDGNALALAEHDLEEFGRLVI